jgi:hypothetical protein
VKIISFSFLLLQTVISFSQTDTNNANTIIDTLVNDSNEVVCNPKYIMVQVVKDLKDYDIVKEELDAVTEQSILQTIVIEQQDSIIVTLKKQNLNLESMFEYRSVVSDKYKLQLEKVSRENEKKKSWIKGLAIALFISFTTNLIIN